MGVDATTINTPVKMVDSILKEVMDLGTAALETALNVYLPFTALPVLKQLIDAGLGWIEGIFYTAIADQGTYLILKFETLLDKTSYLSTVDDLKKAQISNDPLLLSAAEKAWANAASSFIHDDGSAQP